MIIAGLRFDGSQSGNSRTMMDHILRRMAAARPAKFIAGLALLAGLAGPAPAATEIGTAVLVVNNVYGNSLNKRMKDGQTLVFDQTVKTGRDSAARLKLIDDSSVTVGERSEIVLDELVYDPARGLAAGSIELAKGIFRFASAQVELDLTIHTRHAEIGIRGTRFDVYETADATEVAVHEGTVEVASDQGSELVEAGQVYRVSDDEAGFEPQATEEMQDAVDTMEVLVESADGTPTGKAAGETAADPQLAAAVSGKNLDNLLYLDTSLGRMVIEMRPDLAPNHVAHIKALARKGAFDGLAFHNVKPGYVAETGDPTGTGAGGMDGALAAEFSAEPFVRGTLGMKHPLGKPDSADSQFFITLGPAKHLDGKYTVWGNVIYGIEHLDALQSGSPPKTPDKIKSLGLAADAE